MKAVIWHAEGPKLWDAPEGLYKKLFAGFMSNAHSHGIDVIHLTTIDHEGWGDEVIRYDLDPNHVTLNREIAFTRFLKEQPDDYYWFTEPDCRIVKSFPESTADVCFLYRPNDGVPITPSFRLARKSSLPVFEFIQNKMVGKRKDWHGDSDAFAETHKEMGSPQGGIISFLGCKIEFRKYNDYNSKGAKYVSHHKFTSKASLV